jgi:hypothetical protein
MRPEFLGSGDVLAHPDSASEIRTTSRSTRRWTDSRCCGTGFYNLGMASTNTPAQIKASYGRLMGRQAGEAFAEPMQDAVRLHLKWNEFVALFAVSPGQIDTLNTAAPGFFYLVSEAWWDGLILHIFRMTDGNRKVLSLVTLKQLVPPAIRPSYEPKLKLALAASRFAHDLRHAGIGHRNREVALKVKPVPRSSREQIRKAIAAIDGALHFVDHHYTGQEAPIYDHLDIQRGAGAILWIVRRGLRARDDDFTARRPPMRFSD